MRRAAQMLIVLAAIAGLASACGSDGASGRQSLPEPTNRYLSLLSAIWAFSETDVWAVGNRVLHFDGREWSEVAGPGSGLSLTALWGLAADDLWAAAGSRVFRWRGASKGWVELVHGIPNAPEFGAIWVLSAEDWAAGGGAVNWEIVRVKGTTVRRAFTHGPTTGIWGATSDDVWAVADYGGGFWHWNGSSWSKVEPKSGGDRPKSVWGFGANDVWAVGSQDTLQHWDGTAWTQQAIDPEADLNAIWGTSRSDLWAVGDQGQVWRFDGQTWTQRSSEPSVFFTGIRGSGPSSVWAVGYELSTAGNHGVIYRLQ